jgi:lipopolysaccharide export system permease protein
MKAHIRDNETDGVNGGGIRTPEAGGAADETSALREAMINGHRAGESTGRRPRRSFGVMDVVWFLPRTVLRLFFPKILDRYTIGELTGPLIFGWSLFIILFVFSVNLFKLAQLAARGARLEAVGELVWLRVVLASVYCLPMAMLLAGLLAFGRLSGDNELIATQAGGIPNLRPVWNAFLMGLALSFTGLAINEYILPPAGRRLHFVEDQLKAELKGRIMEELSDQKAFIIQDYEGGKLARLVAAKKFEPEDPPRPALMRDVTYIEYDKKGEWNTIISAKHAEWIGQNQWKFVDADTQFRHTVTQGRWFNMHSQTMIVTLKKTPKQVALDQKDATQMSYGELKAYLRDLKRKKVGGRVLRELEVEMEQKLAIPFATVVLALIGAPLGIRRQRSTAGVGIGLSLLIIILYYVGMGFLGVLGQNGQIGAREAAWGCNIVGLLVGFFLTWRSSA